jgi:Arc/MetJ family transcription regulator
MYYECMKLTLNIDDTLLARVMEFTGAKTKTEAIHAALAEIDRRNKLVALLSEEITMTPKEWANAIDFNAWDEAETKSARVAEEPPARRDRKSRSR